MPRRKQKKSRLSVSVTKSQKAALENMAEENEVSLARVIQEAVKEFLAAKAGRGVWVEAVLANGPDLNPVAWAWQHLKNVELPDVTCLDLEELHQAYHLAVGRLRQKPHLVRAFYAQAGLKL